MRRLAGWSEAIGAGRLPGASIALAGLASVLALWPAAAGRLEFDRGAISAGEVWRIFTGHFTHVSADHFFWDVTAFLVLGIQCERIHRRHLWATVLGSAVLISAAIAVTRPDIEVYRGLSGVDSALFAWVAVVQVRSLVRESRTWMTLTVLAPLAAFAAKTIYEWQSGQTVFVDSAAAGMIPLVSAHAVGAGFGCVMAWTLGMEGRLPGSPIRASSPWSRDGSDRAAASPRSLSSRSVRI